MKVLPVRHSESHTGRGIILPALFLMAFVCSCANSRFATGPETSDIEALPGYRGHIQVVEYPCSEPALSKRRMVVYLPHGYNENTSRRYPVLYLLHGARGNEVTWIERGDAFHTLDSLSLEGRVKDFIVVMPNLNNYCSDKEYRNGHPVNALRAFWMIDGETEVHFMYDVVSRVDSLYRTIPEKSARAIAGMSTGGLQALYLSANNPDTFDYIGLFSPYTRDFIFGLRHPEFYGGLYRKLGVQFRDPPKYYCMMIGTSDIFYPEMKSFDRSLTRRGYGHDFVVTSGGHKWINWRKYLIGFYQKAFQD